MSSSSVIKLVILAALWGASFLFMRVAVPSFGPVALVEVRVVSAALFLAIVCWWIKQPLHIKKHGKQYLVMGFFNAALPFCLFSYAAQSISGSLLSIFNASTPIWGAILGVIFLRTEVTRSAALGLILGVIGVAIVGWNGVAVNGDDALLPILASLGATFSYGVGSIYTKMQSGKLAPMENANATLWVASIMLVPFLFGYSGEVVISTQVWLAALALGVVCTGVAYVLFFNLLETEGPMKALSVTFLIPVFAMIWGNLFLGETVTLTTVIGGSVIVLGTALTNGLLKLRLKTGLKNSASH